MVSSIARNVRKRNQRQRGMVHPSMFKLIWRVRGRRRSNNGRSRSRYRPRTILARPPSEQPKEANEVSLPPSNSGESSTGPIQQSELDKNVSDMSDHSETTSILEELEDFKTIFDPVKTNLSRIFEVLKKGEKEVIKLTEDNAKLLISFNEIKDKRPTLENKINKWVEFFKEVQRKAKRSSELVSSSVDWIEAVVLLADLRSD